MFYNINAVTTKLIVNVVFVNVVFEYLHYYKNFGLLSPSNWHMNTTSNTARKYSFIHEASVSYIQRVIIKYRVLLSVVTWLIFW